ncbi:MAG: hypothetical protein M1828_004018 [Chrysothrix sp. TS-e1954]|nr:MAG: hypothetical protein M1828_004018 [Chrysothrix sp. TS-e1954]
MARYFLGHKHGGRQFASNVHAGFAPSLNLLLTLQIGLGIYLRLHIERGFLGRFRKWLVKGHGVVGKILPVAAWVQMLFGGIVALGFCRGDHLGQCLAHFIMGSAFIGYGILLTILLLVGQFWLRRTGRSQEFFDSLIIAIWGCVNTFTEHRWGTAWVKNDLQHTSMGIVWWCAGLVGMWLSRTRDGRPKRNIIPGVVILLTGYGMSAHPQALMLSTMVHAFFGYTLMAAGLARIIEVSFVLRDKGSLSMDGTEVHSWQHLPPFLLYASGFLFMGATEEQMALMATAEVTHVSYILILYSIAFLLYFFVNVLLHIYGVHAFPPSNASTSQHPRSHHHTHRRHQSSNGSILPSRRPHKELDEEDDLEATQPLANGHTNGASKEQDRRMKDAQEYELDALISDGEGSSDGKEAVGGRKVGGGEGLLKL